MQNDLDQLINTITNLPSFQKLKTVVENNNYHDNEDVYTHSLSTMHHAQEAIKGDFIKNPKAKELFTTFLNQTVGGLPRKDVLILVALLHDIGKILSYEDGGKKNLITTTKPDGKTQCAGHEYLGSTIVEKILTNTHLSQETKTYIATCIKLHDTFNETYFEPKKEWPLAYIIDDIKSRAEGKYIEALFNIYCDNFAVERYQFAKNIIEKVFNNPLLYTERKYFIA